ncbi:dihydrofolate reductase family protein [Nocardioides sp.]|uniref:dihydrofolate reductase family protein n=1 Tax=Nocardioides sp. TaxID=35761 RepID=UPI0035168752
MDLLLGLDAATPAQLDDDAVRDGYPWPEGRTWVRAMMVTTLDGGAADADGLSAGISSPADKAVFFATRRLTDVVLIGSGTLRAERYKPMHGRPEDADRREADGRAPAPRLAVVSGSLDLPWELEVWRASTLPPLILTTADADPGRLTTARAHAEVAALPELTPHAIIGALAERGLHRIVCEGGPTLLRDLVAADLVDEADITFSPTFAGTAQGPSTATLPDVARFRLAHVLHGEDFLMARYLAPGR